MKILKRNKKVFYYALVKGLDKLRDENGLSTGENVVSYHKAVKAEGSIIGQSDEYVRSVFGGFRDYEKVIVLDDMTCPIVEDSILFVEKEPEYDTFGIPLNDYVIKRIEKTLNFLFIAISTKGANVCK